MTDRFRPCHPFMDPWCERDPRLPRKAAAHEELDRAFNAVEELYRKVEERADRAQWLCDYAIERAEAHGLPFDCERATQAFRAHERCRSRTIAPWYQERRTACREEVRQLREDLARAHEIEQKATAWAMRERHRAEVAEAECGALMAKIHRLRAMRRHQDY